MNCWLHSLLVAVLLHTAWCATEPTVTTATTTTTVLTPVSLSTHDNEVYLREEPAFPVRGLVLECFAKLSWPCAQRKLVIYLDELNRARSVRVIGDLVTLVKVTEDYAPPITEDLLSARKIEDQDTLTRLLELVADRFMESHVLRINLPSIDSEATATPVDVNFFTARSGIREGRGKMKGGKKKKGGKKMLKKLAKMGKMGLMMLKKILMLKMLILAPLIMKKALIGALAGFLSMAIMKIMMLKKLMSLKSMKMMMKGCPASDDKGEDDCGGSSDGGGYGGGGGGGYGGGGGDGGGGHGKGGGGGGGWGRIMNVDTSDPYSYYRQMRNKKK